MAPGGRIRGLRGLARTCSRHRSTCAARPGCASGSPARRSRATASRCATSTRSRGSAGWTTGLTEHDVFVPSHDAELVDAWFRLSFGASAVLAMRETEPTPEEPFDGDVTIRRGTPEDFDEAARLDLDMTEALRASTELLQAPAADAGRARDRVARGARRARRAVRRRARRADRRPAAALPPAARPARRAELDRPRAGLDRAGGARHRRRPRADRARDRAGPTSNGYPVMTTDWRMTNLWASRFWPQARLSTGVPARVPVDPVVQRVPLLFGTRLTVVDVPDDAVVLRPPPPGEPVADVRAAVRDALRFPLAGEPLEALVTRGGRATIVVEPPALPLPGALNDPRQARARRRLGRARAGRHPDRAADAARLHGPDAPAAAARARAARRRLPRLRPALPRHRRDPGRREPGARRAGARRAHAAGRPPARSSTPTWC